MRPQGRLANKLVGDCPVAALQEGVRPRWCSVISASTCEQEAASRCCTNAWRAVAHVVQTAVACQDYSQRMDNRSPMVDAATEGARRAAKGAESAAAASAALAKKLGPVAAAVANAAAAASAASSAATAAACAAVQALQEAGIREAWGTWTALMLALLLAPDERAVHGLVGELWGMTAGPNPPIRRKELCELLSAVLLLTRHTETGLACRSHFVPLHDTLRTCFEVGALSACMLRRTPTLPVAHAGICTCRRCCYALARTCACACTSEWLCSLKPASSDACVCKHKWQHMQQAQALPQARSHARAPLRAVPGAHGGVRWVCRKAARPFHSRHSPAAAFAEPAIGPAADPGASGHHSGVHWGTP